jgi:protease I
MKPIKVLIPIPQTDYDPSEVSISWDILHQNNIEITFATPNAQIPLADKRMLDGSNLGLFRSLLKADDNALNSHGRMLKSDAFQKPIAWTQINVESFDGLILPGGHASGIKSYLESIEIQNCTSQFFQANKVVGAICHGVIVVARSKNRIGQSILFGKKTTALLKSQELIAWGLTCLWLGNYYRTYAETVQDEVIRNLKSSNDFISGPFPLFRDSPSNLRSGFTVEDGNYISARWPGDAHLFASRFVKKILSL